jgi:DNA-binding CsgD family transcriptional regulator
MLIRISLFTALAILLFKAISLLTIYSWLRLDFYLCLVAVCFLGAGYLLHRHRLPAAQSRVPAAPTEPQPATESLRLLPATDSLLPATDSLRLLSAREWQILRLVAEGKSNKEIAAIQFVQLSTVKTHLNNIYGKLSVANRKEARMKYTELAPKWPLG